MSAPVGEAGRCLSNATPVLVIEAGGGRHPAWLAHSVLVRNDDAGGGAAVFAPTVCGCRVFTMPRHGKTLFGRVSPMAAGSVPGASLKDAD